MSKTSKGNAHPAYEHLLEMILNKQLMPGDRIPEVRISQELGISRTPVRDAMRRLANEGLIEIFPNRFAQVVEYSEGGARAAISGSTPVGLVFAAPAGGVASGDVEIVVSVFSGSITVADFRLN